MVQGTTPTFVATLPQTVDLEQAEHVYFTFDQGGRKITKQDASLTIDKNTAAVSYTQAETILWAVGQAFLQLNWTYADGKRACSNIVTIEITENLLREVLA